MDRNTESLDTFWDLVKDIRFAMLTTRARDGSLHTRPLTVQNRDEQNDDALWFFVSRSSEACSEAQADELVSLAFADPGSDRYVGVAGVASLVEDASQKRRLWSKVNDAWFPNGPDDPDVALLRVQIQQAEYWDVKDNKLTQLLKMARAAVTGHPPKDMGDHGTVRMH